MYLGRVRRLLTTLLAGAVLTGLAVPAAGPPKHRIRIRATDAAGNRARRVFRFRRCR